MTTRPLHPTRFGTSAGRRGAPSNLPLLCKNSCRSSARIVDVDHPEANELKQTRFALQKNPWNLTTLETEKVARVQKRNQSLYRAYLLKETLAAILDGRQVNVARRKLGEWIDWAARSRLEPFAKVARTVSKHIEGILGYVATRLSNGPIEGNNGKIRTITRRSYGFAHPSSVIALIHLCFSGIDVTPRRRYPNPTAVSI